MVGIELQAGAQAFGDGTHPSTQLAAAMMQQLAADGLVPERVLDMGCGSGLLALLAAQLWPNASLVAVDSERSAVQTAAQNFEANGVETACIHARRYRDKTLQRKGPFGLVVANIVADVLLALAPDVFQVLEEKGVLLLSGILRWRLEEVLATHALLGLTPMMSAQDGDWCAVALAREGAFWHG